MRIDGFRHRQRARDILSICIALVPLTCHGAIAQSTEAPALIAPVTPACISSPFGPRVLRGRPLAGTFHNGIDLPAPVGAPVWAVAPGTVIRVQRRGVGGLEILVQHAGFVGVYSHLGLIAPIIAEGRRAVHGGQRLATVARSGLSFGPHLYFGMMVDGRPVDPAPYLDVKPCEATTASAVDGRIPPKLYSASTEQRDHP
jgi:murein DD-endopeptidase MepM/ murein hydrolase activator NlpD